jgi:hypothetical protein
MRFDDLASRARRAATDIGRTADHPTLSRMLERQRRRRQVTAWSSAGILALAVFAGAQLTSGQATVPPAASPDTTTTLVTTSSELATATTVPVTTTTVEEPMPVARDECPVTVSGDTPFTPVAETPQPPPPESFQASWFGTPDLWTFVYDAGQMWVGLPVTPAETRTQITMWWSQGMDISAEPNPEISMVAEHILGSPSSRIEEGRVTTGGNPEMGQFALVRLDFPHDGCWEITTTYKGATVSYVAWVEGRA